MTGPLAHAGVCEPTRSEYSSAGSGHLRPIVCRVIYSEPGTEPDVCTYFCAALSASIGAHAQTSSCQKTYWPLNTRGTLSCKVTGYLRGRGGGTRPSSQKTVHSICTHCFVSSLISLSLSPPSLSLQSFLFHYKL